MYSLMCYTCISKADPGLARWMRAIWFENFMGFVFVNFDCITNIHFDFSQHAMFTICILFTTLLQRLRVFVKRPQA